MNTNIAQTLISYYGVPRDAIALDADIFLGCVRVIDSRGHSVGAVAPNNPAIWHLPFENFYRCYPNRRQLGVACFLWAMEQIIERRMLVTLQWSGDLGSCRATPFRTRRFDVARTVLDSRAAVAA